MPRVGRDAYPRHPFLVHAAAGPTAVPTPGSSVSRASRTPQPETGSTTTATTVSTHRAARRTPSARADVEPRCSRPGPVGQAGGVSEHDPSSRRVQRLRLELEDEGIALPDHPDLTAMVLTELDYARHPHSHEGLAPRYGALLSSVDTVMADGVGPVEYIDVGDIPLAVVRRLADGRSSFVARSVTGADQLVCFNRTREYESSAVHLAVGTGGIVIQRLGRGWVRLCTSERIATWDGTHWSSKPLSVLLTERVAAVIAAADHAVLGHLLDFCTHWLGAGRVGATLVWALAGDPLDLPHLGDAAAVSIPELDMTCRTHFAPLLNALAQYDRAVLIDPRGRVSTVGVHLRSSAATRTDVASYRGTRHTSALRFSHDVPSAAVFVVSSSGSLSVFWQGQRLDID